MIKFKKALSLVLSIILGLLCGLSANAESTAAPYVRISSLYDVLPGQSCEIQISLSGVSNIAGGYDIEVQFPEIITVNKVKFGDTVLSQSNYDYRLTEDNILILYDSFDSGCEEFVWTVSCSISAAAEVDNYPISFYKADVTDWDNLELLEVTSTEGTVAINVDEATLLGDTDGDGSVLAVDLTLMRKHLLDTDNLDFIEENSDMNRDGDTDIKDLVGLKKYLASLTVVFKETSIDENCQYLYVGEDYAYAITADGKEIIAFYENGKYVDALSGAGKFVIYSSGISVMDYNGIADFTETKSGEDTYLTVTYDTSGENISASAVTTTYLFHNSGINVVSDISVTANEGTTLTSGVFKRDFINSARKTEKKINYSWIYPEYNDYPYQETESVVTVSRIDSTHSLYTFNRDDKLPDYFYLKNYPSENIPVYLTEGQEITYKTKYDIAFENIAADSNADCNALFSSQQSNFSLKAAPAIKNDDNSTVFIGDSVTLNITLENLEASDISYALDYSVMDYYGNTVAEKTVENASLSADGKEVYEINISGGYGMYYLNLTASSDDYSYTEYYPLMLIEDYEYEYLESSPFGIDALHRNTITEENTSVSLCEKLGIGTVRVGASLADLRLSKKLYNSGINTFVGLGGTLAAEEDVENLVNMWNKFKGYCEWFTLANEVDYSVKGNLEKSLAHMNDYFIPNFFNDLAKTAVEENDINISWCASCHGNEQWAQAMYESGVWLASDVIDTHLYCYPKQPDKKYITENHLHSVEYGLQRIKNSAEKYGMDNKLLVIGETGYPTVADAKTSVDIRTQADFNTRIGILSLAYGADIISYYSMYDRTSYFTGTDTDWSEMNFGAFYNYDYYGITKPKPWAAAYASLTRQLDGVDSVAVNETYDEDTEGTVRAFTVTDKNGGELVAAWTNIYALPNTTSKGVSGSVTHDPTLPWQNQWAETEEVTFEAVSDTVSVTDTMGNTTEYTSADGTVTITLTGSPVYIKGVK